MGDKDWGGLHCRRGRNDCRLQHANLALLVVAIAGPLTACRFSSESPQLQVLLHWIVDVLSGAEPTRALTIERTHVDYRSGYLSFIYMDGYKYSVKDEWDGYSCTRRGMCTCVNICV